MSSDRKGLVCIFTGDGKGKTTAALGMAIRASGQGLKVLILQFMKGIEHTGEILALKQCGLPIEIRQFGRVGFVQSRACEPLDRYLAHEGLKFFREKLENASHDMIVLDEILVAVSFGLLKIDELFDAISLKPEGVHLVMTGRRAPEALLEIADLATEMREIKHPYNSGVRARRGIEF
ncbi:MAG: cob(I)yrinic acid a,c-diamide adenosyltransferase [Desulfobacterales bacterium]|nr:cob(I)yrinic acid a,c-diamide adenosyltransferase [Desulfobacterales bacterium]